MEWKRRELSETDLGRRWFRWQFAAMSVAAIALAIMLARGGSPAALEAFLPYYMSSALAAVGGDVGAMVGKRVTTKPDLVRAEAEAEALRNGGGAG